MAISLKLYVTDVSTDEKIAVYVADATQDDLNATKNWQTNWTSEYALLLPNKVALRRKDDDELLGLMSYFVDGKSLAVEIIYVESADHSNANLLRQQNKEKKYIGIAKALFAYAIDVSLKEGCDGVLIFKAKTTKLVNYYKTAFGAQSVGSYDPFRLVIWEDAAADIMMEFQEEG